MVQSCPKKKVQCIGRSCLRSPQAPGRVHSWYTLRVPPSSAPPRPMPRRTCFNWAGVAPIPSIGSSNSLNLSPIKERKKSNPIHLNDLNGCRIHPAGFNQQFEFADQSIKSSLGHTSMGAWFQSISDNWGMISLYRNLYKVANRIERIQSKIRATISKEYKTSRKRCATDIITFMAFQNCLKKDIAEKNIGEGGQSIQGTCRCYPIVCPSLSVIWYSKTLLLLNRHHKE